jgi:hypothetical protein
MTEYLLPNVMPNDPAKRMIKAITIGTEVGYVRKAEMVISDRVKECPWHLEDPDGETIDDEYPVKAAVEAYRLMKDPQKNLDITEVGVVLERAQVYEVTSRHVGLAGNGFWYLDGTNTFGVPNAILYIAPWRLTPDMDGLNLKRWILDATPGGGGVALDVRLVKHMTLQTPDLGVWAQGLVESAMVKAFLNGSIDRHFSSVLSGGGRLSGIISPKEGAITDDNVYQTMVRDWRNVTEQPESAKRVQIVRAPVDFIQTVQTVQEMGIIDLMGKNRDDLLALWGVPLSQIGGTTPAGLNGGDVRKYDEAALWQNAIHPRLGQLLPKLQSILDLWDEILGWCPRFVFDEPSFDDDSPRYARVQQSTNVPLKNSERRDLLGLPPFGPDVIGTTGVPLDDEVYLPINIQPVIGAPEEGAVAAVPQNVNANQMPDETTADEGDEAAAAEAEPEPPAQGRPTPGAQAKTAPVAAKPGPGAPPVTDSKGGSVQKVTKPTKASLEAKRWEVVGRLGDKYRTVAANPGDHQVWWGRDPGSLEVRDALKGIILMAVQNGSSPEAVVGYVRDWPGWEMLASDA